MNGLILLDGQPSGQEIEARRAEVGRYRDFFENFFVHCAAKVTIGEVPVFKNGDLMVDLAEAVIDYKEQREREEIGRVIDETDKNLHN